MAEAEDMAEVARAVPSESLDVRSLPYPDRRLVVVARDEVVALQRESEAEAPLPVAAPELVGDDRRKRVVLTLARGVGMAAGGGLGLAAVEVAIELAKSRRKANEKGIDVFVISRSEAVPLTFPVGHPRERVVYVGHPANPACYLPMADFHRSLFEHKVAEALRLVTSLGATEVAVEHVSGWTSISDIGAGLVMPVSTTPVEVGVTVERATSKGHRVMSRMDLVPRHAPAVPDDLAWYAHEPLWREVARARLDAGLRSFRIDVKYTDDFGVHASLKAAVAEVGLEVGGSFTEHQDTVWRFEGTFGELTTGSPSDVEVPAKRSRWTRRRQ